jgi:hypothetical protein
MSEVDRLTTVGLWVKDRCMIFHSLLLEIEAEVPRDAGPFDHLPICLS